MSLRSHVDIRPPAEERLDYENDGKGSGMVPCFLIRDGKVLSLGLRSGSIRGITRALRGLLCLGRSVER